MKRLMISYLLLVYLIIFTLPIYGLSINKDCKVFINHECVKPPLPLITIQDDILIPLRWFAMTMGASSVTWDENTHTVTVVVDDFFKSREYLSYLDGLQNAESHYPLPTRLQNLNLPDYLLYSMAPTMIHPSPIGLNIVSGDFTMPWAVYDYAIKHGTLYVGIDWLNTLFLAQIENADTHLSIIYPASDKLDQSIAMLSQLTMPLSPEEALALWIHGQQTRNGALQYSALSSNLKEIALANLRKQGWVTGGSTPSLEAAIITSTSSPNDSTFIYEVTYKERGGIHENSQIHQKLTTKKHTINGQDYWFITDATGDLDYYSILSKS